jgi:hypothetical protein
MYSYLSIDHPKFDFAIFRDGVMVNMYSGSESSVSDLCAAWTRRQRGEENRPLLRYKGVRTSIDTGAKISEYLLMATCLEAAIALDCCPSTRLIERDGDMSATLEVTYFHALEANKKQRITYDIIIAE